MKLADLAYFANARFEEDLILEGARLYSMQLDNVTFNESSKINLNSTDFSKFVVHWSTLRGRMVYNGAAYLALVKNYKSLEWFDEADECYYQYRRTGQELGSLGLGQILRHHLLVVLRLWCSGELHCVLVSFYHPYFWGDLLGGKGHG